MRRSKLEMHIDILKALARQGPLKLSHIMYKARMKCNILKQYLDFLIQQDLVRAQTLGKRRIVYAITERGLTVLKQFGELNVNLLITERERPQFLKTL